eukprot:m.232239 g.232239  ORF g.232239 m.232239 type:complete len:282 (+) comp12322_c0_seq1:51-896(+)
MGEAVVKVSVVGVLSSPVFQRARIVAEGLQNSVSRVTTSIQALSELAFLQYKESVLTPIKEPVHITINGLVIESADIFLKLIAKDYNYIDRRPKPLFAAMASQASKDSRNPKRTYVFMDFSSDGKPLGRVVFELFSDICPKTAENFAALCSGAQGRSAGGTVLSYVNSPIHRVQPGGWLQGGDIVNGSGASGEGAFAPTFADENFVVKHDHRGVLSMANSGPHTNGSQYFVTLGPVPAFDGKYVAFGEIHEGAAIIAAIEAMETYNTRPISRVLVTASGVL